MTVYVLETNADGSGLDILKPGKLKKILVTDDLSSYSLDPWYACIDKTNVIDFDTFYKGVSHNHWPHGQPTCVISNSDKHILEAVALSEHLRLPSPDKEIFCLYMSKLQLRINSILIGLPVPYFAQCNTVEALLWASEMLTFPVVIKPAFKGDSIAATICYDSEDVMVVAQAAFSGKEPQCLLVEEFISGPSYTAELLIDHAGEISLLGFTNHERNLLGEFLTLAYTFPVSVEKKYSAQLLEYVSRLHAKETSLLLNVEFIIDLKTDSVVVMDINPRVGEGMLSRMISENLGVNIFDIFIDVWMQKKPTLPLLRNAEVMSHFFLFTEKVGHFEFDQSRLEMNGLSSIYHQQQYVADADAVLKNNYVLFPLISLLIKCPSSQLAHDIKSFLISYLRSRFFFKEK